MPDCTLLSNKPREPSLGSVRTTRWNSNYFQMNELARCSEFKTFTSVVQNNSVELTTRDMPCRKMEAWQTSGTFDDGDILCHPMLVLPYLQAFDTANVKIGADRNPQKTEVI